jgi:cyclase
MAYHTNPRLEYPIYYGTEPIILKLARKNRKKMTAAERKLWEQLKDRKFLGIKFRRQHPISRFIADFYCHQAKLIIEVDGGYHHHQDQQELDIARERALEDLGIKVIRFSNEEVERDLITVLVRIKEVIQKLYSMI